MDVQAVPKAAQQRTQSKTLTRASFVAWKYILAPPYDSVALVSA